MKKTTVFLALMLALSALSCGQSAEEPVAATDTAAVTEETAVTETEQYFEADNLPDTLDFGGKTVTVLGWTGENIVEFEAEQDGDVVNDAIYTRNKNTEERLNVDLVYDLQPGSWPYRNDWAKIVSNSVMAQDAAYDIVAGYSMAGGTIAQQGLLLNLNGLSYLDFTKPWWPSSLIDEAMCGDKLYVCSGDISTSMIYQQYAVFFNKNLLEQYDLENPYPLVTAGKWTLDKMMEYSTGLYKDLNGNGDRDAEDQYGLTTHATYADTFYFSSGLRTTERGDDGLPVISADFGGEKTQALLTKLIDYLYRDDVFFPTAGTDQGYIDADTPFISGNALFSLQTIFFCATSLRDTDFEYGILPVPKYDEEQEAYRQTSGFPYTLYGIPVTAADADMSAAVMECMASESYRTIAPALFETALKVKYASDNDAAVMYDIIRESAVFDIGRIFTDCLDAKTYSLFRNSLSNKQTDWISTYAKNEKGLNKLFDKLITALVNEEE